MTHTLEAAISEARWKARVRRTEQLIVRFQRENGEARYVSSPTLTGMMKRTRVGESPLCILSVMPDGYCRSRAKEFDGHNFNTERVPC